MAVQTHQIEQHNNTVVATLQTSEVTPGMMQEMLNDMMMRMRYDNAQFFVLDLRCVNFISSSCLGGLVSFLQDLEHVRGRVALVGCKPDVQFLFKVTRLDSVFHLYDDLDEALAQVVKR